jgi:hypothetical protein
MSPQAILYAEDTIGHVRLHCDCSKCARRKDGGYGDIVDVGDLVNRLGVRNGCYWLLAGMQPVFSTDACANTTSLMHRELNQIIMVIFKSRVTVAPPFHFQVSNET